MNDLAPLARSSAAEHVAVTMAVPIAILGVVRHLIKVLPEYLAHGHGEVSIVVTPGVVDIKDGKWTRYKINT